MKSIQWLKCTHKHLCILCDDNGHIACHVYMQCVHIQSVLCASELNRSDYMKMHAQETRTTKIENRNRNDENYTQTHTHIYKKRRYINYSCVSLSATICSFMQVFLHFYRFACLCECHWMESFPFLVTWCAFGIFVWLSCDCSCCCCCCYCVVNYFIFSK